MKHILLLVLISSLALAGCESDTSDISGETIKDYYPLNVGNEWMYLQTVYNSTGYVEKIDTIQNVVDSIGIIDGRHGFHTTFSGNPHFCYYSANAMRLWDPTGGPYYTPFRYPVRVDEDIVVIDSIVSGERSRVTIRLLSANTSVTVPAGTFTCLQYNIVTQFGEPTQIDTTSATMYYIGKGVGLVKVESFSHGIIGMKYLYSTGELLSYSVK